MHRSLEVFNIGRAVAGFGPLVVGIVSAAYGFPTAIAGLALLYSIPSRALRGPGDDLSRHHQPVTTAVLGGVERAVRGSDQRA